MLDLTRRSYLTAAKFATFKVYSLPAVILIGTQLLISIMLITFLTLSED